MSLTIYLMRHAKAESPTHGQKDFDRMLAPKGHTQAPQMGVRLKSLGCQLQLLISSPADRAAQTARYVAEQIQYDADNIHYDENIYSSSVRILMGIINQQAKHIGQLMLVGHNPEFSYLAEYLTGESIGNMPTAGVVKITFEVPEWGMVSGGNGTLAFFEYPSE